MLAPSQVRQVDEPYITKYAVDPPPYYSGRCRKACMRVSDDILTVVVFIGTNVNGRFTPLGTGFCIYKEEYGYNFQHIVTARHVIENISLDDIYVRINLAEGGTSLVPFKKPDWKFHPNSSHKNFIDVAVAPCNMPAEQVHVANISLEDSMLTPEIIEDEIIGIGDEMHFVGLYTNHVGQDKNIPIIRIGNIASMPSEPFQTEYGLIDGYLMEAHSLGGSSGSPVFVGLAPTRAIEGEIKYSREAWYLAGLLCGHWTAENPEDAISNTDQKEGTARINTGIVIVIPVQRIYEVINGAELSAMRKKLIDERNEKLSKNFSFDSANHPKPTEGQTITGDDILSKMLTSSNNE